MKLISWNVNGMRACLKKGFAEFFKSENAYIFCIQETKLQPQQAEFAPEGYYRFFNSAIKKGYSGTAIHSKKQPWNITYGINVSYTDKGRIITTNYGEFYLLTCYSPNVKRDLSRLSYRMEFEDALRGYIIALKKEKPVIPCDDLNVAHEEIDIKNPKINIGNAGFTYEEREKFSLLLKNGFTDIYRYTHPDCHDAFTWWSYRFFARERNISWRIDYFIISDDIRDNIKSTRIYTSVLGSDHCPIGIELQVFRYKYMLCS